MLDQVRAIFEAILSGGYDGLKAMVGTQDEHLFLDFKEKSRVHVPGAERSDRETYSKALSGFSNAGGGVLLWGLDCRKQDGLDLVRELKPIPHLQQFVNDLNGYLPGAIQPFNVGIENQTILVPGESDIGFVVTFVPESDVTPHRSLGDHLYYSRSGNNFIRVDHPMLADMFGRRQRPKLEFVYKLNRSAIWGTGGEVTCDISVGIRNVGRYVARFPGLILSPNRLLGSSIGAPREHWAVQQIKLIGSNPLDSGYMWFGGRDDVIHPTTTLAIANLQRVISRPVIERENGLTIVYELLAEGCEAEKGSTYISLEEFMDAMGW